MAGRTGGYLTGLIKGIVNVLSGGAAVVDEQLQHAKRREADTLAGPARSTATIEIEPPPADGVRITYAPERDGEPDAGEVVDVGAYEENDGRGKDRPVLVIGRQRRPRVRRTADEQGARRRPRLPADRFGRVGLAGPALVGRHRAGVQCTVRACGARHPRSTWRFAVVAQALQRRYGWQGGE
jgi:hypothetical protein